MFTATGPRDEAFFALMRIAILCNRAEFKLAQTHIPVLRRECTGDPSGKLEMFSVVQLFILFNIGFTFGFRTII
ncbi:unnamed protein product [Meloidogyne enterolobii]|uniref:Uncharacterized protein n=1 Tax=Meloidogyne enterolobii TaxID=390850 RepID=A0ACB0ZYN0_MELEN